MKTRRKIVFLDLQSGEPVRLHGDDLAGRKDEFLREKSVGVRASWRHGTSGRRPELGREPVQSRLRLLNRDQFRNHAQSCGLFTTFAFKQHFLYPFPAFKF